MQKFLRGQVWFYSEQEIVKKSEHEDSVQRGSRPVIIVSNDTGNKHSPVLTVVPCTTQGKTDIPTHFNFILDATYNTVLCEQIFTIGKASLIQYRGTLEQSELATLDKCLSIALNLTPEDNKPTWLNKEPPIALYKATDSSNKATPSAYNTETSFAKIKVAREKTIRTKQQKEEIINAYCNAESKQELQELANKYGFSNAKMLIQSVGRWMSK